MPITDQFISLMVSWCIQIAFMIWFYLLASCHKDLQTVQDFINSAEFLCPKSDSKPTSAKCKVSSTFDACILTKINDQNGPIAESLVVCTRSFIISIQHLFGSLTENEKESHLDLIYEMYSSHERISKTESSFDILWEWFHAKPIHIIIQSWLSSKLTQTNSPVLGMPTRSPFYQHPCWFVVLYADLTKKLPLWGPQQKMRGS